ncbi:MAG: uracil-DNA glycosylase [Candidatus Nanohaloarchaea archaeon]|nr:uracil-DNA glycosylase [Candidatus Nanohaloarchaea archaeon]
MDFDDEFADALGRVPDAFVDRDRFVPAVGSLDADVVLAGEAPGANEVEQGEPFVGRAGEVLDEVLQRIGVEREAVYITNLVKVRPPDNRDPTAEEIAAWKPVLDAELARVDPDTVVALGTFAAQQLLGTDQPISRIRGTVQRRDGRRILPTFHPAATLYDPDKRPVLEQDLRTAFGTSERGQTTLDDM